MIDVSRSNNGDAAKRPYDALASTVDCVADDFRRLVDTLARVLDVVDHSHPELLTRVAAMKHVAERGLELSRELLLLMKPGD